jgi:hypothetical protein
MPGFEVNTEALAAGRGHQDAIAAAVAGTAGMVRAAASAISESAGHAGASAAGGTWGAAWESELARHADGLRRSGVNLAAAADAYRETDEGQMRT